MDQIKGSALGFVLVIAFLIIALFGVNAIREANWDGLRLPSIPRPEAPQHETGIGTVKITLEQFNVVRNGMNVQEVERILGGRGVVQAESELPGQELHTIIYTYDGKGSLGANASFTFQNGRLVMKAQHGLR